MTLLFSDPRPRVAANIIDLPGIVWDAEDEDGNRVLCTVLNHVLEDMQPGQAVSSDGDALAAWRKHQSGLRAIASALYSSKIMTGEALRRYDGYPVIDLVGTDAI